jgi:hypothetical protein
VRPTANVHATVRKRGVGVSGKCEPRFSVHAKILYSVCRCRSSVSEKPAGVEVQPVPEPMFIATCPLSARPGQAVSCCIKEPG